MKSLTKLLVTGLIETLIITGCARQPITEIEDAKAAINAVVKAKGDVYAKDEVKKLYDDLQASIDEIDAQSKRLFKKYGPAKEMLAKIVTNADVVKVLIPARIEENKSAAVQAQAEAEKAVAEAKALLEKAPKGKGTKSDIEAQKADLASLETSLAELKTAIRGQEYIGVKGKATAVKDKAAAISDQINAALERVGGKAVSLKIYPSFPWPPPQASALEVIPRRFFERDEELTLLKHVDQLIGQALDQNGYYEKKYYAVPEGFALVTRMEHIESDGTPMKGTKRWALGLQPLSRFSLAEYLRALLGSDPGHYRLIAFIITPCAFEQSETKVSPEEAQEWFKGGMNVLPTPIGEMDFSKECACTALIYEFERVSETQPATVCLNGHIPGRIHLIKAGIWERLQR